MSASIIPSGNELLRESLVIIGGAILAALVLSQLPELRNWIASNTRGAPSAGGCNCNDPPMA